MTRRALLLLPATLAGAERGPITPNFTREELMEFEKHYEPMLRNFFGCPAPTKSDPVIQPVHCVAGASFIDGRSWKKAREAAKRLFQLR